MAPQADLKSLRVRYREKPAPQRPLSVTEEHWSIFCGYFYQRQSARELGAQFERSVERIREILVEVADRLGWPEDLRSVCVRPASSIEQLDLSVRARNVLRQLGCRTVEEVLRIDFGRNVRRVGQKTRLEIFNALENAGFRHPASSVSSLLDIRSLARSLERMQSRIDAALRTVAKEVSTFQNRLRKKLGESPASPPEKIRRRKNESKRGSGLRQEPGSPTV